MKLNAAQKEWILYYSERGFSSREISSNTGVSKSAINYFLNGRFDNEPDETPRILFLDVETSADIVATFGRRDVSITESHIVKQGNELISAAWTWNDSQRIQSAKSKFLDFEIDNSSEILLLEKLVAQLEKSDTVVIHNAPFDLGTIQHRMLYYGMGKIPTVKVTDTLRLARKYLKLRSNKLESIAKYFGLDEKMTNSGMELWIRTQRGDKSAMKDMLEYNKQDVVVLREIHKKFQSINNSLNLGLLLDNADLTCTSCGSTNVENTGRKIHTGVNSVDEYKCNDCGSRMKGRKSTLDKSRKENLLALI